MVAVRHPAGLAREYHGEQARQSCYSPARSSIRTSAHYPDRACLDPLPLSFSHSSRRSRADEPRSRCELPICDQAQPCGTLVKAELTCNISDLTKVGSDASASLNNVGGIRMYVNISAQSAVCAFDSMWIQREPTALTSTPQALPISIATSRDRWQLARGIPVTTHSRGD